MNMNILIIVCVWLLSEFFIAFFQEYKDIKLSTKEKLLFSIVFAIIGTFIALSTDIVNILKGSY